MWARVMRTGKVGKDGLLDMAFAPDLEHVCASDFARIRGLTKFELARVVGFRAEALGRGAMPRVPTAPGPVDCLGVAHREVETGTVLDDITLKRTLPNGTVLSIALVDLPLDRIRKRAW